MSHSLGSYSAPEDEFVARAVSRDVEDKLGNTGCCFEMTKSAVTDPETLLPSDLADYTIPKPMSTWEVEDFKEALMGDHESHYMSDQALLGIPSPRVLATKLKQANLRRQREIRLGSAGVYRLWPLLPLSVKAEINPLLATLEVFCTFIVLLTWVNVIFFGATGAPILGGIALLVAQSILHYWYGFTRYYSTFQGDWFDGMVTGKALDKNFEQTRDICSYQCHGDKKRRSQMEALLLAAPFTILNHVTSLLMYGIYKLLRLIRCSQTPESPALALMWGVFLTNLALTVMMMLGGAKMMTYTVLNLIINQRLYNAMLFRRNFEGFLMSFLCGNLLIGEVKSSAENSSSSSHEVKILPSHSSKQDREEEKNILKRRDILFEEIEQARRSISYEVHDIEQDGSVCVDDDILCESNQDHIISITTKPAASSMKKKVFRDLVCEEAVVAANRAAVIAEFQGSMSIATSSSSVTNPSDSSITDASSSGGEESSLYGSPNESTVDHIDVSEQFEKVPGDVFLEIVDGVSPPDLPPGTTVPGEFSTDFLNDVYLQNVDGISPLDSHPGTKVWHAVINESTEIFSCSSFDDKHHDWIMSKLGARDVYTGSIEYGWICLSPMQVRTKCREAYEKVVKAKQVEKPSKTLQPEIEVSSTREISNLKKKRFGKLLQKIRLQARQSFYSAYVEKSPVATKMPIYLGQRDSPSYQHFRNVIKLAAEKAESKVYSSDTHAWVILRTNARSFHLKNSSGFFQKASEDEVRKHAAECFAEEMQQIDSEKIIHQVAARRSLEPQIEVEEEGVDVPKANKWKKRYMSIRGNKKEEQQLQTQKMQRKQQAESHSTDLTNGPESDIEQTKSLNQHGPNSGKHFSAQAMEVALQYITNAGGTLFPEDEGGHKEVDDSRDPNPSTAVLLASNDGAIDVIEAREEPNTKKKHNFTRSTKGVTSYGSKNISSLGEDQKEDPELVKKWIVEQTKSLRTRSRFFGSLWSRARKLRRKKSVVNTTNDGQWNVDDDGLLQPVFSEEGSDDEEEKLGNKGTGRISSMRQKWFNTKSAQPDKDDRVQKSGNDSGVETEEEKGAKPMEEPSFYDLIMAVLVQDYLESKNSEGRGLTTTSRLTPRLAVVETRLWNREQCWNLLNTKLRKKFSTRDFALAIRPVQACSVGMW